MKLFRKAQKEACKIISLNIIKDMTFSPLFLPLSEEEMTDVVLKKFQEFIADSNVICLDNTGVDIDKILDDYFTGNPPFEIKEEKKHEFPDAFIISKLKAQFSKENPIHIISKDEGFKSAFDKIDGFYTYSSVKELLDTMNRQSELYGKIISYLQRNDVCFDIRQMLKERIESEDIFVNGMDCDRKGYCEGYEYDESYIAGVSEVNFHLSSVDDIADSIACVTITCDAKISAICTYLDTDNSIWDSEEKEYMYSAWETIEEEHRPKFDCTIEFSIIHINEEADFSLSHISFDLALDQNTRTNRIYIESEDPRVTAEAETNEALEDYYRH